MAKNWLDLYSKFMPPPAAGPYAHALPGPGGVMPGAGMGIPTLPPAAFGAMPPSLGGSDPSSYPGGGFSGDKLLDRAPLKAPFAADQGAPATGPSSAIQWAVEAIRNGADPKAVRAQLNRFALDGSVPPPSDPLSDINSNDFQRDSKGYVPGQFGLGRPQSDSILAHSHKSSLDPDGQGSNDEMPSTEDGIGKPAAGGQSRLVAAAFQADDRRENPLTHMMATDERVLQPSHVRTENSVHNPVQGSTPQQVRLRGANEAALDEPMVLALLDTVASAEGADYNTMFGRHRTFNDMRTHPGYAGGRFGGSTQSAAGRYQIELPNYRERVARMGPLDMSPASQDLMAADIFRRYGALDALQANDLASAISNLSGQFASLPHRVNDTWRGSRYRHQTAIPIDVLTAFYDQALLYYSMPGPIPPRMRQRLYLNLRQYVHN